MTAISGKELVITARTYIGTPFHHAGRLKGVGIDCIGLLVCIAQELGFLIEDRVNYTTGDEFYLMIEGISEYCESVSPESPVLWKSGDILVFRDDRMYNHCAMYVAPEDTAKGRLANMIHAYNTGAVNRVVEHELDSNWLKRIIAVYRFREAL